ncbi:MAG: hypothetical protein IJR50_02195 [Treponema sp.]|nr:hypothetical protein [Treponema sp.]
MIQTLNESSLHRTLKNLYALENDCSTEVALDGKIYDIVDAAGNITEIQTGSVSKLLDKTMNALQQKRRIKIVHPIAVEKYIALYDERGVLISKRKSPVKRSVYDMFRELTGLYPVLLKKNFLLDVLEITMTEKRVRTPEPVQSKNNRRRFRKSWLKQDKQLEKIIAVHTFKNARDYVRLIPESCLPEFSARTIENALKANTAFSANAAKNAHLLLWVLSHMNLIELCGERPKTYRLSVQNN